MNKGKIRCILLLMIAGMLAAITAAPTYAGESHFYAATHGLGASFYLIGGQYDIYVYAKRPIVGPYAPASRSCLFGGNAPNYMGGPTSLEHARGFYHATNPGSFFRALVPTTQLFLLLAIVFNWRQDSGPRWQLVGALACLILTDMITFRFHYPRNDILFVAPLTQPAAYYDRVVTEWAIGNYARVALILITVVLVMVSTIRIARDTAPVELRNSNSSGAH